MSAFELLVVSQLVPILFLAAIGLIVGGVHLIQRWGYHMASDKVGIFGVVEAGIGLVLVYYIAVILVEVLR